MGDHQYQQPLGGDRYRCIESKIKLFVKPPFSYLPALPAAIGWMAGILLWNEGLPLWGSALPVLIACGLYFTRNHYFAFGFAALAAGWLASEADAPSSAPPEALDGHVRWYCASVADVAVRPSGQRLMLDIDSLGNSPDKMVAVTSFRVMATSLPEWMPPRVGERFVFDARLDPIDKFSDIPGDNGMRNFMTANGIAATAFIEGATIIPRPAKKSLRSLCAVWRERIVHSISTAKIDDETFGLLSALLVGTYEDMSPSLQESFRSTGAAHALALSGFHLGVIVMLVAVVLFPLKSAYRLRRFRLMLSLAMVWAYVLLTGMPPSIVRAAIMLSVFVMARVAGRKSHPLNSLCVAMLVILAFAPRSLFSPGLQLSASAVAGIIAFAEPLNPFDLTNFRPHWIAALLTVPVSAVLGTLPVSSYLFHSFPVYFLLSNLVVAIVMPWFMASGVLLAILALAGLECGIVGMALDCMTWLMDISFEAMASLPGATLRLYPTALQCILAATAALFLSLWLNYNASSKGKGVLLTAFIIAALAIPLNGAARPESEWFVHGMAGSTQIVARHGHRLVISPSCHVRSLPTTVRRLRLTFSDYIEACGIDTVEIMQADFVIGPYSRRGDVFSDGKRSIALAWDSESERHDSVKVDYVLVCSRFRGDIGKVAEGWGADTIVIGRDVSPLRKTGLLKDVARPVIDLRGSRLGFTRSYDSSRP